MSDETQAVETPDQPSASGTESAAQIQGLKDDESANDVEVQRPQFQEFTEAGAKPPLAEIDRLQDIKIVVSAELGRTEVPIQRLLSLGPGSLLELDRSIDSPVELVAQGVALARGEVVVVNDRFAIRVTEIVHKLKDH